MTTTQQGYLVISDITGYTAFLAKSELEHAQDSLRSLLNLLLEHTKPPLVVSKLEGDAVFSYASGASVLQGQTLMETMERTYVAFRQARDRMVLNTTCNCKACINIPNLDLKFFVHYGAYTFQQVGSHTELLGTDVILIHRLTKNNITEKTGARAYGAYTQAATDALGVEEMREQMTPHKESYEHLGDVAVYVQSMDPVWEREQTKQVIAVEPRNALISIGADFPVGLGQMWDFATKPEYRNILINGDGQTITDRTGGRIGPGAVYHCAHGKTTARHTIVDWRPLEQYSWEERIPLPGSPSMLGTVRLTPIAGGTRINFACSRLRGPLISRTVGGWVVQIMVRRHLPKGIQRLRELIGEETAAGRMTQSSPSEIPSEEIDRAVSESLTP